MKVPKEPQSASQRTAILRASSYLPWSQTTQVPFRSCEAYFGNGFTNRVDLLKPKKDLTLNRMGWFKCWFSETLRSSVCEGGGLRMDPEKIKMSRGGEILEEVIGRGEEEELPEFQTGAFQIDGGDGISGEDQRLVTQEFLDEYVPHGAIVKHTMRELIGSVRIVPTTELQCNELGLFITELRAMAPAKENSSKRRLLSVQFHGVTLLNVLDVEGEIKDLKGFEKILSEMLRVVESQLKSEVKLIVGGLSNKNSSIKDIGNDAFGFTNLSRELQYI